MVKELPPLERAARALFFMDNGARYLAGEETTWSTCDDMLRWKYLKEALAVLDAIREPDEDHVAQVKTEGLWSCAQDEVGGIFTAMIEVAMADYRPAP